MGTKLSLDQQLRTAAEEGDTPGVEEALDNGAGASSASLATGSTALHLAVDGLHYDVVKLLLSVSFCLLEGPVQWKVSVWFACVWNWD